MPQFTKLLKHSEVAEGSGKAVTLDGKRIAVFNTGDDFLAIDDTCVHQGGRTTGKCTSGPQVTLQTYTTKVEGEDLMALL